MTIKSGYSNSRKLPSGLLHALMHPAHVVPSNQAPASHRARCVLVTEKSSNPTLHKKRNKKEKKRNKETTPAELSAGTLTAPLASAQPGTVNRTTTVVVITLLVIFVLESQRFSSGSPPLFISRILIFANNPPTVTSITPALSSLPPLLTPPRRWVLLPRVLLPGRVIRLNVLCVCVGHWRRGRNWRSPHLDRCRC